MFQADVQELFRVLDIHSKALAYLVSTLEEMEKDVYNIREEVHLIMAGLQDAEVIE